MNVIKYLILLILIFTVGGCSKLLVKKIPYDISKMDKATLRAYELTHDFLDQCVKTKWPIEISAKTRIDTILIIEEKKRIEIYFNPLFGYVPFREQNTNQIFDELTRRFKKKFKDYEISVLTLGTPIEQLIPNFYRSSVQNWDKSRLPIDDIRPTPLIRKANSPLRITQGLNNRYIAVWPSHGWYYENKLQRWEWQRARVFQTVEDLLSLSFIEPYLLPMLENSGAYIFLPRERDLQIKEIIVDNDSDSGESYIERHQQERYRWENGEEAGFAIGHPPYLKNQNPFLNGTSRYSIADTEAQAVVQWIPDVPETAAYGVYISYAQSDSNISDAHYQVNHLGGTNHFLVNQQIAGGTWIYLGQFRFKAGRKEESGSVTLSNESHETGKYVTADAVRFGGGMGNIQRNGQISERPRFSEAARYYLQYSGMPDTLVYSLNGDSIDYNDDYQCRGEWVNYLKGAPYGPNKNRDLPGLGLPIDLSLAFHTDAGYTRNDTVVGTLLIYSSAGADTLNLFPDGVSRLANRDFADILQSQLVEDIRKKYEPSWQRRYLWDRPYSEAYRPNVPAALLELLSHHNFLDMKFAQDPRFRFDAARSIYKAMLKFLATQYHFEHVVHPLPVTHMQALLVSNRDVELRWQPVPDPLEPTAVPEKFIVYIRKEDEDFDQGRLVDQSQFRITEIEENVLYSFKVTAVNRGGESFPSEILSICKTSDEKGMVLIVNGFDRICGPATLETDKYLGFADFWDQGVPDRYDLKYVGRQYDFDADSPWLDDDAPGHGASYGDGETKIIAGNSFDYPLLHGKAIRNAGYSFVSVSDEVVEDSLINLNQYQYLDLILGEEKTTDWPRARRDKQFEAFPAKMQKQLRAYCQAGKHLLISGAYIGTDLYRNKMDSLSIQFAENVLKYKFRTNYAVTNGKVYCVNPKFLPWGSSFVFNTDFNSEIYAVEAPDAIEPSDSLACTLMRYSENNSSAVVGFKADYQIISLGFPFETIIPEEGRDRFMQAIFDFFENNDPGE